MYPLWFWFVKVGRFLTGVQYRRVIPLTPKKRDVSRFPCVNIQTLGVWTNAIMF